MQGGSAAFDDAILGMAHLDADFRVLDANKALATLLGRGKDELRGHSLVGLLSGLEEPPPLDCGAGAEFRLAEPAAAQWARLTISGDGPDVLAVVEDLTESKAFDAQMRHAERLSLLGDLVSALSHEVGQPLNVMRLTAEGALDRMESGVLDAERHARSLNTVIEQAGRLQDMLDHILVWARPPYEAGRLFCPLESIDAAVARAGERVRAGQPVLSWDRPDRLGQVFGHAERFEQALYNLIVNAISAAPRGHVAVTCRQDDDSGELVVCVADDGPGLPAAVLERLTLGTGGAGRRGSRLGLGLTVALGIAAEMGGFIAARNTHPGAQMEMRLPFQHDV